MSIIAAATTARAWDRLITPAPFVLLVRERPSLPNSPNKPPVETVWELKRDPEGRQAVSVVRTLSRHEYPQS
jgi:hypothetical protein